MNHKAAQYLLAPVLHSACDQAGGKGGRRGLAAMAPETKHANKLAPYQPVA